MSATPVTRRRSRTAIAGIPVMYIAVWAAIYAVAGVLPAIPLVGGGTFGGQEFILVIAGMLFGPVAGLAAATIGGLVASLISPATAYFGLLTFYPHAIGALAAGLLVLNRRWARLTVFAMLVVLGLAWPLVPPFSKIGYYVYQHYAYWPMYLTAIVGILLSGWAVTQIKTFNPARVWMGVAIIGWTAYMVNHEAISLGYSYLYPEGPQSWVTSFWTGIIPGQRILLTAVATFIGTALIVGLHRSGIRFPAESGSVLSDEDGADASLEAEEFSAEVPAHP